MNAQIYSNDDIFYSICWNIHNKLAHKEETIIVIEKILALKKEGENVLLHSPQFMVRLPDRFSALFGDGSSC